MIRPHGEEARARDATAMLLVLRARAVSNHEGGLCVPTSSFETHRTVGKCRLCDAPQDEVDTGSDLLAVGAPLFTFDALLHADRGARILAQDFAKRGAGRLPFAQGAQRLAEPQQCVGCLGGRFVSG